MAKNFRDLAAKMSRDAQQRAQEKANEVLSCIHYWDGKQMVACGDDVIDYPKLLRKYIEHVVQCESISFVSRISDGWGDSNVEFTDSERLCLENMARQAGCVHMGDG